MKSIYPTIMALLFCIGCATDHQFERRVINPATPSPASIVNIRPPKERKLVAIAGFENKSAYAADKLWDTSSQMLSSNLIQIGYFRVVEWGKMKQLFEWDALSASSIVKVPAMRDEARKILLCEYFLSGAITRFDVNQRSQVSALYKKKVIDTTIRVDLMLQSAYTGEYMGASTDEWTVSQEFEGGLTGGSTGTWDPASANLALNKAIEGALAKLIRTYSHQYD
jgi:curli biogenesis system outer membrane secretion channel CsgG